MHRRLLTSVGALALGAAVASLAAVRVAGQAPAAKANATAPKTYIPPRTTDDQPDLQGVWLSNSATPLERPKALERRASVLSVPDFQCYAHPFT
jgi:hypothetical protein